ncbi:MAG TPA: amidohydrolase family protein, partial [Thermoanaerobaculia bacterium]|nr:amidohydrolase family protein [Thermoanaerobaculia bacterium]
VHLAWKPSATDALAQPGISKQAADDARTTLLAGFTTVRDLGSTGRADLLLRDAIARGELPGPRMLAAGPGLGAPGGACDVVFGGEAVAKDAAGFARRVEEVIAAGADVVKVCTGGGVIPARTNPKADLTAREVKAIVAAARAHGRKVAAHAQGEAAIEAAIDGGVSSIEHGGFITARLAKKMKQKRIFLVPTLYRLELAKSPMRDALEKSFVDALAAGVPVALGTDATVIPHGDNARELATLVRLGMSPIEAIRAATTNAATLLGRNDIGVLAKGKRADIIAVDADPLRDVTALQHVTFVMKDGKVHLKPGSNSAANTSE